LHTKRWRSDRSSLARETSGDIHDFDDDNIEEEESIFRRIVYDTRFEFACGLAIILNLAYLGVQTDQMLKAEIKRLNGQAYVQRPWVIGDLVFSAAFSIELALRVAASKKKFVTGSSKLWNLFDSVVLIAAYWEIIADIRGSQTFGASVLKSARIFRIVRLLRVGKKWRIVQNVKTILFSLAGSFSAFLAIVVLLCICMYTWGIVFMIDIEKNMKYVPSHEQNSLEEFFGSMGKTLWTLLASITGGYDWNEVATPLVAVNEINAYLFALYILCMILGLINVMNALIVQAALKSAATGDRMTRVSSFGPRLKRGGALDVSRLEGYSDGSEHVSQSDSLGDTARSRTPKYGFDRMSMAAA
jgi:hypothetical protein